MTSTQDIRCVGLRLSPRVRVADLVEDFRTASHRFLTVNDYFFPGDVYFFLVVSRSGGTMTWVRN